MRRAIGKSSASSQSIRRLRIATLRLLDEHGPSSVSITDVVREAGVTRPTFYAAFGDLPTAFADAASSRLDEAFDGLTVAADVSETERAEAMAAAFLEILNRLEPHSEFYSRVLHGPGGMQVHAEIVGFVAGRLREHSRVSAMLMKGTIPASVTSSALAAGITWTITTWLSAQNRSPAEELAVLLRDLIIGAVTEGLSSV